MTNEPDVFKRNYKILFSTTETGNYYIALKLLDSLEKDN